MKILLSTECYAPMINGVVTSVMNLERELMELGHEVRILTLSTTNQSYRKNHITYIRSLGAGRLYPGARFTLRTDNECMEELIDWQPDIIHSQCEFSTFLMARQIAKRVQIPIVHTYHTVYEDYTHYFSPNKKWGKAMVALFTRVILKNTECVIAPTNKVRSLLVEYGVNRPIQVIPTGINLKQITIPIHEQDKQMLRKQIGIPGHHRVLLFVGRLAKEKNIEEIIWYLSKMDHENVSLLIVGDGPHREALEQYAKKLGMTNQIHFVGMVSPKKISSYYQLGDVFVSASNSETQGLTYVEALANGVPELCRKDACLDEVIKDGVNGWQYSVFEEFAEKLQEILSQNDQYQRLSNHARAGAISNYSSDAFARKVEQIYQHAISSYEKRKNTNHVLVSR
jgi:1,2-diacylglycerol 3-alpha-glucosyltransferase